MQGVSWSPCGKYIAAWDSPLSVGHIHLHDPTPLTSKKYSLHIHSAIGPHLTHFNPSSPAFSLAPNETPGLGLRALAWAPGGRWIAVGGWDGKVRIVESDGWRCVCVITCGTRANKTAVGQFIGGFILPLTWPSLLDRLERTSRLVKRYQRAGNCTM